MKFWTVLLCASLLAVGFMFWWRQPVGAETVDQFIQADGAELKYGDDVVKLLGTNFANVNALGAGIGTGNIDDIYVTEADYIALRANGANHVRFGLSFDWYQDDPSHFFAVLDQQVAWARAHNLWIVWNMFTTPGDCYEGYSEECDIWYEPSEQAEFEAFWVAMANRYKNEPAVAGYGLLNEPNPQTPDYCTTWFTLAEDVYNSVHAIAPNQLVFIAACSDPGGSLRYRDPPFGDNIVYEVHDYTPITMTHNSTGDYPGEATSWFGTCTYNLDAFRGNPQSGDDPGCVGNTELYTIYGIDWGVSNNVPMYIGEWGTTSSLNGYVQFHEDKATLYNEWGVSSAHYTWKHNTIVSGGSNLWGIYYPPLRLDDPLKLAAVQTSWAGAIFPNYSAPASPTPSSAPGQPSFTDHFQAKEAPVCSDTAPATAPYIFQVDRFGSLAIVYLAPAGGSYTSYYVGYGRDGSTTDYGFESSQTRSTGAISYVVRGLNPRGTYSFKVRAGNGCATGEWSNTLKVGPSPSKLRHFYPSFLNNLLSR